MEKPGCFSLFLLPSPNEVIVKGSAHTNGMGGKVFRDCVYTLPHGRKASQYEKVSFCLRQFPFFLSRKNDFLVLDFSPFPRR